MLKSETKASGNREIKVKWFTIKETAVTSLRDKCPMKAI